jgi:hypothetical protein
MASDGGGDTVERSAAKGKVMSDKLYMFWGYDQFPYFLGAELRKWHDSKNLAEPVGYTGFYFKPIKILPHSHGKVVMTAAKTLELEYRKIMADANREYRLKIKELLDLPL